MTRNPGQPDAGGVALFEESILILRSAPAADWLLYLSGALPFVVGLLWFCTDALRNLNAAANLAGQAFQLALLFLFKQFTEAVFASRIHARISRIAPARISVGTAAKAMLRLTAVQPWSLLALLIAAVATVPLAGALFFFRNFSLFAWIDPDRALSRSGAAARAQQGQAWRFVGLVSILQLVLYVNFLAGALTVAMLSKSFFGIDYLLADPHVLLRSPTIHASVILLGYLCTDALLTAAAVLRSFQTDSVHSGADILAGVRRAGAIAAILVFAAGLCAPAIAQTDAQSLDRALDETLARREFAWRMPPTSASEPPVVVGWAISAWNWVGKQVSRFFDWLDKLTRTEHKSGRSGPVTVTSPSGIRAFLYLLIGAVVLVSIFAIVRILRSRGRARQAALTPVEARAVVDVSDEATLADHLSEDSWLSLADELIAKGDHRLALRALYLSGLRLLSERKLVTIQRWKSGFEYLGELRRRSREPALASPPFQASLRLFELGWYGFHPVDPPMLDELRDRLKELRSHAIA